MLEGAADIAAQIEALADPAHPKRAVFVARGNESDIPPLPVTLIRVARIDGTFIVADPELAARLWAAALDDRDMAQLLDLPEAKPDVRPPIVVVQARDAKGRVVTEACVSFGSLDRSFQHLARHVPSGGSLVVLSLFDMHRRRLAMRR